MTTCENTTLRFDIQQLQDLIFKLKISSSNPINHGCFCLLIGLRHTSHVWISDTLFIPLLSPDIFTAPQKNLLELTHASHAFTACSFGLYFVTHYSLPCISLSHTRAHSTSKCTKPLHKQVGSSLPHFFTWTTHRYLKSNLLRAESDYSVKVTE